MAMLRKCLALALVCVMLACAWPVFSTNARAGSPLTLTWYSNQTVRDSSGGEAGVEWWYGDTAKVYTYYADSNWAQASVKTVSPVGGARVWAGVYKEINFAAGKYGYYTATMTGNYKGQCYVSSAIPGVNYVSLKFCFRLIDLNSAPPNNIITENVLKSWTRSFWGTETHKDPFTSTIGFYSDGTTTARWGLEAYVVAQAEAFNPTSTPLEVGWANAYLLSNTWFGIWYSSISITTPYPAPGCVAEGTLVTMADGTTMPVEKIQPGSQVLGYDVAAQSYVTETVQTVTSAKSPVILDINNGALRVTPGDQPIYVKNATGVGWVTNPCDIQLGWQILDVKSGSWVTIVSLELDHHKTKVYDFQTDGPMTYLANGYLVLDKPHK